MEEIQLTLEDNLRMKESMEWGFNYYTGELNQLGYTHQAKDNELEVYDEEGTLVGKSYLEKEGHVTSRKFEAITSVPPQVEELTNHLLLYQITMRSTERDIALLQQESLVKETAVKYGSKEEVPARIFPAVEHGNLKNISFEGIPSEEARNYLKEHSWRYSRRNRAWYPGTKEAQANNETFVKGFVQKFYPNSLPEAPQTHSDIPILEEIETEPISQPHLKNLELDNQDTAEPIPESAHEEQSSPEAIAPKTEYSFTPTIGTDGIIDYTGVEVDKIRLPNKTQILNQFLPSYLPPVEIRREGRYDIPAVKVADNQYLLKGTKKGGPIYRVSLDVYAALVDYHLKYDRAARKAIADYNNNVLKEALENEQAEFFPLRTKLPSIPEPLSFESHCQPERKRVSSRYQYSPGRVAFQQSSSHRMTSEVYYFIESEIGSGNSNIFSHHRKNLEELQQKMLDMELQHSDLESTWTKGRETAYGDSNLDESLLATYGVNIKRQNGNTLSAHEKTELQEVLNQVYSTYGNLSSITKDYGLKISHSGTTRMHASKAVGLFTPGMKALGISFGLGKDEAIYTANHEMAHFIDHLRGKEHHAWHASDIPGTLENKIAATFRQGMNTAKGDYWNRTCECFARAMEEYGKIVHIQQKHPDWDSEKINEKVSLPAYMEYTKFYRTMIPLIQEWIETTHSQMKISEWHLQDSDSLKQKNVETEKITKSQSKGIRDECLEILKKDDSQITSEDLAKLRAYEGAGGLGDKNASVNGVLNEFYTPNLVVKKMWELADAYAPNAITVLEPTAGTGRFAEGRNNNQFTMYEVDKTSARINQLLHPQATVINESFQKQFFDSEGRVINKSYSIPQFDLVIGNPPYGDYKDKWRGLGEGKEFDRYEEYFLSRGIDSLKNQDSLMIMIVPSGFLNSNDDKVKQAISSKGKLLDAWRLPEGVFPTTKVGTDILVFQRGSCQVQELCNGNWFKNHPEKILGEVKTRTNRFGKQEEYVDFFAGHSLTDTLNLLVPDKSIDKLLETSSNFIEETLQENQQEVANAESIHQSDRERETHLRGEGVGGQPRGDNGTNVPGQYPKGGSIVKDPTSPDSEATRKPVQQPTLQHNSPAPEGNDSQTSGSLGNQAGRQGGMESHTPPLHSSIEQLSDRLTLSAQEFSQFYTGNNFSQEEYPILLATDWQGKVDSSKLTPSQCEWLKSSQKYIQVEEGKFVNRNIFCSGNIYHKLAELEAVKATLPAELYNIQKKALEESIPPIKSLDKVELSPLGSLSQSFQVTRELSRTNYDYLSHKNIQSTSQESIPLAEDFIAWATGCYNKDAENSRRYISDWTAANISREDLPSNVSWSDIVDYIEGVSVKSSRAYTEEGKNAARIEAEEKRQARKETAEQLFNRYIRTALPEHDREQLTQEWNKRFNSYVAPDYSKLPVLVDGMSTRKDNKPFELYEQQVKGVAFLTQKGNGLLAYDVGVGKTAAGIVATVSQLQSGRAKRPLIIVPKAVYTKWIHDFQQLFPEIPINDLANFSPKALESLNNGNHGLTIPEGSISFCTNEALQRVTFEDESIAGALFEDFSNLLGKSEEAHSDNAKIRAKAISAITDEIGVASQTKEDYVFFERCGFDHITVDEAHRFKNLFRVPRSSKPDSKGMSQEFPGLGQGTPSKRAMKMFAITQMVQRNNDNRNVFMLTATPFTNSPLEVYSMLSYIGREQLKSSGVYDIRDFCTEYAHVTNEWAVDAKGAIKPKSVMKSFRNPQSLQSLITQYIDKVDGEEAGIRRPNKEQHQIQLEMNEVQKMIVARETERMLDPEEKDKGGVLVAMNNMRMAMVSPAKEMDAVKDALVKRGIPASCIALIRAGDNLSEEKIDEITSNFNDKNHKLKILIGSKKIAEGVDLNGNSIALYNTMLDWNPTETIQVEGRIWRQGNKQERVHIMYPLMEDSIESLIYQKHDEKSNRINDIFSYKGDDALDVSSINPEELKFDLIKDPQKKADFIISQKTVEMKKELTVVNARISTLSEISLKKANLQDLLKMAESSRKEMQERLDFPEKREKWFSESLAKEVVKNSKTEIIQLTAKLDTVNRRMQKMGLSDEASLENLRSSLEGQKEILQKQIDMVASSRDEIIAEERIMLLEKKAAAVPIQQQVDQMVRHIIENTREAPPKEARKEEPTPRSRKYEIQDEPAIEYPVGKYGQLELFAFEQTPSYNFMSIPSLIEKPSAITVQEPSPQYLTSGDPHLTKEHIWKAKAATRTYCNPVLDGKKSGLWKNFRDFKKHGVLDILGANAEMKNGTITPHGWNQLSTALQIYRDKRFETFRYLFVSPEGKIQDQLAVCSQLPGKALANLPGENLLEQVIAHAENTGTKVVLVHNHPSGNIMPSTEDILMTEKTEAAFTRSDGKCLLAGHIILDHDSYSLYQKGKEWQAHMLNPYDIHDPLLKTRNPMEGITVSGPQSLELVAQAMNSHDKWKEEGWVPVVFTTSRSQISAVKLYPEDFLAQNNTKLLNQLQETARQTGAVLAFPIILDKDHIRQENQENLLDRMRAGCFTDFYLGEKDGTHKTAEDFNLMPGRQLFEEVGMEQMAAQTSITSTFPRHQKQEMASLGLLVAEDTRKEYESFLGQIDDYLERGKLPEYNRFILTQTPSILEFTGIPQNHVLLSTGVLNKAKKIHGLNNEEIMDSVKGLFSPLLVFSSDKSTSEAKNDSVLIITEATAKNGKPVALALELNREMTSHKQAYEVNDIRSIHDRTLVAQNGVDILKKWTGKGLLRYYDDKKISDWMELRRVQFPLSLTKSDIDTITLKDNSVKTRSQFENSMVAKIQLESALPEKLLTPSQIREGKHQLPVKQEFMENNSFFPPMELAKDGMVHLHCTTKDLSDGISLKNKSIVLKLTSKQAAVIIDASIKQRFMDNRQAKQPTPLNIAAKSKMEENFFTGLKSVHPQLTRKEADKQYHQVYSLIEKELKELRHEPVKQKSISRKSSGMEW